jgi:NTP pyrophosphatase (non-canonical NTP hydrolase)
VNSVIKLIERLRQLRIERKKLMRFEDVEKLVIQWGIDRDLYIGSTSIQQMKKLQEELDELLEAVAHINEVKIIDGIGDMMVVLTHISAMHGFDLFKCYCTAYLEIKDRRGKMIDGLFVKE